MSAMGHKQTCLVTRKHFRYTTESGQEVSNTGIRETIQQMIADENSQKPLSDSAIEKNIKEKGIKVARRTIAKYRDQLNILPSHLRKQF